MYAAGSFYAQLNDKVNNKAPLVHSHAWADITGKPSFSTVATSGSYNDLSNKPTIPTQYTDEMAQDAVGGILSSEFVYDDSANTIKLRDYVYTTPTFSSATTATQLSATRKTWVSYTFDSTVTISLLAGQSVTATLKYADNSGMSTNVVTVKTARTSNSGVLGLSQVNNLDLFGHIPAGKYRQVTFTVSGGASAPSVLNSGQEVQI